MSRSCVELLGKVHSFDTLGTERRTNRRLCRRLTGGHEKLDECCGGSKRLLVLPSSTWCCSRLQIVQSSFWRMLVGGRCFAVALSLRARKIKGDAVGSVEPFEDSERVKGSS